MTAPWTELLAAVLADVPNVPGAPCIGRHELMEDPGRTDDAIALCRQCRGLDACTEWAAGQRRLVGVVAGRSYGDSRDEIRTRNRVES
ncbi:MAG: hypothetical protein ACRDTV_12475 [Mycobacterium sp.]